MLNDIETYEKVDTDPLRNFHKDIFMLTNGWTANGFLGEKNARKVLGTENINIARIHGLPKVHKTNYLLRSAVSCINTPTYFLAKTLDKIISNTLPKPKSFIKNAIDFKESIIQNKILNKYLRKLLKY